MGRRGGGGLRRLHQLSRVNRSPQVYHPTVPLNIGSIYKVDMGR